MPYAKPKEHQKLIIKRPAQATSAASATLEFPRGPVTPLQEFKNRILASAISNSPSASATTPRFGDTRGTTSAASTLADSVNAPHAGIYSHEPAVACLGPAPDAPVFIWGKIEGAWDDNGTDE